MSVPASQIKPPEGSPVEVTKAVFKRWYGSPLAFAEEFVKFKPDDWQKDLLELVRVAPKLGLRIALMACKGPGKSAVLAVIILWFAFTRTFCRVGVTSITGDNLRDGLWAEMSKWGQPLRGVFDFTATRIAHRAHGENWFISARTWPKRANIQAQSEALAGLHADYVMYVLDEVSEYPEGVVAAAEGALTTGLETILLAAGNCTRTVGSPLYRMVKQDAYHSEKNPLGVRVIRITGDPDDPKRSRRVSEAEARKAISLWGRDHPIVRTNFLAEFPLQGTNKLLSPEDLQFAMEKDYPDGAFERAAKIIGIDVARFGDDKTIFFPRQGVVAFRPLVYPYVDRGFHAQASVAVDLANRFDADAAFVEIDGLGAGLWDAIRQLDHTDRFIPVSASSTQGVEARFHNLRAQMHFRAAAWVKDGGSLPLVNEIVEEGSAESYGHSKGGKLLIESKEIIKEMLGRSPDFWDSFCLTHPYEVVPRLIRLTQEALLRRPSGGRKPWDYNPFQRRIQPCAG